jgi:hypothetical protein
MKSKSMRRIAICGGALLALFVLPILSATTADARKKDHMNMGYCKNGKKVSDLSKCKENGGK